MTKQNANPTVYRVERKKRESLPSGGPTPSPSSSVLHPSSSAFLSTGVRTQPDLYHDDDDDGRDPITSAEVFDLIRNLNDPEHPLTLEELKVATPENVKVDDETSSVDICFTPTIPHCSMATLIGLCIRVKLLRSLPKRFKVHVSVTPGSHASEAAVNKQLNDKERVAAALENAHLLGVVNKCLNNSGAEEEGGDAGEAANQPAAREGA